MSACGNNKALDALKAKQAELDSLLQGGKDELAAVQAKLDAMAADLNKPKDTHTFQHIDKSSPCKF